MTATRDAGTNDEDGVAAIIDQWGRVRPDLDVSALGVLGRLHRSFLLYRSAISEVFAEVGLNESGFDVLAALRRSGPRQRLSAGELARQTLVTTGGLTLRVKRLEKDGLVRRERSPSDHRIVHVSLTPAGRDLVDRAADVHFPNMSRLIGALEPDERADLARLLGRLYTCLDEASPGLELSDLAVEA
jgi:DNA-binding MarR family transcriptional regulator